jgi:hypothetical protein
MSRFQQKREQKTTKILCLSLVCIIKLPKLHNYVCVFVYILIKEHLSSTSSERSHIFKRTFLRLIIKL